jgi:hypothetical protein
LTELELKKMQRIKLDKDANVSRTVLIKSQIKDLEKRIKKMDVNKKPVNKK